ncbi:MAG: helix-turn-helix domain-containing protein [Phaeodactylibacter sp.]|nr:helix-turn-helix domain-containing protein [Phaeodactylibacter sp.]
MSSEPIKTYPYPDAEEQQLSFSIKRMEDLHRRAQGRPDHPHRHGYFTVIWAWEAAGLHRIDFEDYPLGPNHLFFLSPGQVHQLLPSHTPTGWVLNFSEAFLAQNNIRRTFITDLNLFRPSGVNPALIPDASKTERLKQVLQLLEDGWQSDMALKSEALGALLKLFLIYANEACTLPPEQHTQQTQAGRTILRSFKELVEQHYHQAHKVRYYADKLAVTTDYLNKTVKALTGQNAKAYIQNRVVLEAKRLLHFTDLSAKELSYQLGFEEPAHFSAFFKNCTGQSPTAFRQLHSTEDA